MEGGINRQAHNTGLKACLAFGPARLSKNPPGFSTKGLQSAARIICPSVTDKFHTGSLRSIFSHAHVARENDFNFLPPAGGKLCEAFFDTLTGLKACLAFSPAPYRQRHIICARRDTVKKTRIRLSLFSLVLALVLFGLTIRLTGRDPLVVYWNILTGSFGSTKSFLNVLAYMLPLIMTGLGAAVAFQSGVFNIGGEGQVLVGGLASVIVGLTVPLPAPWGWLLALLAGFAAGALWALLPTLFAGRNLTSLSVATIMMNSIAALLTEYIVKSYFQRPGASNTETVVVNEGSILPRIFPSTQFNYGILVALFCVAVVTWMLYKTPFGFSLRAMGSNPRAMQQAGLPIYGRTIAAMCISGGLFALGGSIQCLAVYKRFVMGFSPGYGWDGITVATLAMNSPVGVLLSAFLFGMLRSASISMSLTSQVTTEMISVLQGFIVMLVASPDVWNVLGHLWQRLKSCVGRGRKQEGAAE